jgi:penicillin amidase
VLGTLKLLSFGLSTNWDMELGRLRILELDGPEALRHVDPGYPAWLAVTAPPGSPAGSATDRLAGDLAALAGVVPAGGSNNWALSAARTATGRPLVANDPHLGPQLPPFWYLAHLRAGDWDAAGATVVGAPGVALGHNGVVAWGATNSGADVVDLFLEEVGEDGRSVRAGDRWSPCDVLEERIEVRGGEPVVERVVVTPRGPVISPALEDGLPAVSMRAAWLDPRPLEAGLVAGRARNLQELHAVWSVWPGAPLNIVGADSGGAIGWRVCGRVPRRERAAGLLPRPGSGAGDGWEDGDVAPREMPAAVDPEAGWVATANNKPVADGTGPWLGADWMDGYRVQRISEELEARRDWDVDGVLALQLDVRSLVWRDVREEVLRAPREQPRVRRALELLHGWDGQVDADSPAAAVFELFLAEMMIRAAAAKAPRSAEWALGRGANPLTAHTYVGLRQAGHVAGLLRERPEGWFEQGWDAQVAGALEAVVERLERERGRDPARWQWGDLRPLTLRHPVGERRPFDRAFNLGPIPWGGDTNTVAQASSPPLDPTGDPLYIPTLRFAVDVGEWDRSRFVLAGGQSGNPLSPHYADQYELWRRGQAAPLPYSEEAVAAAIRSTLRLEPAPAG